MEAAGLKHAGLTEHIIGIFYDVYNELGYGFLESVYEESLVIALREAGLEVESQVAVPVWFRRHKVGEFRAGRARGERGHVGTEERASVRTVPRGPVAPLFEKHRSRNRVVVEFWRSSTVS